MGYKIEDKCTGCGICAEVCDLNIIQVYDNYIEIDMEKCNHCSKCVESCPNNVFTNSVIMKHFIYLFKNKIKNIF